MPFGSFPKGIPSIAKITGDRGMSTRTSPILPKRITSVTHLGNMLSGFKRRFSGPNSRLGPPKQPHVTKRGLAKGGM
jgi:hypothetical protein